MGPGLGVNAVPRPAELFPFEFTLERPRGAKEEGSGWCYLYPLPALAAAPFYLIKRAGLLVTLQAGLSPDTQCPFILIHFDCLLSMVSEYGFYSE